MNVKDVLGLLQSAEDELDLTIGVGTRAEFQRRTGSIRAALAEQLKIPQQELRNAEYQDVALKSSVSLDVEELTAWIQGGFIEADLDD